jgi:hypothetical protein
MKSLAQRARLDLHARANETALATTLIASANPLTTAA